jgi:hypothetical protein
VRKRICSIIGAAALSFALVIAVPGAGTAGGRQDGLSAFKRAAIEYKRMHGYLPLNGADTLARQKAHAAAVVAARTGQPVKVAPTGSRDPIIGASWQGVSNAGVSPPDANGAIGPNSYVEIINQNIAIYNRTGGLISTALLTTLTGDFGGFLADPMVLWDPHSQRFYYNVWDVFDSKMDWGFSKDANPTTIPGSWCNYISDFGYDPDIDLPDYPKLGQTREFLLIGVNHYTSPNFLHADRTDVLWVNKYMNPDPVTTCPPATRFGAGLFTDLRNEDGTVAFTPVPAIATDTSSTGFVMTASDIECPDICGVGNLITVHSVRPSPGNPRVPQLTVTGQSITVPPFEPPPDAPQDNSSDLLDTLDGRLMHAVSGRDPANGNRIAVWLAHSVLGGAGAQINWYEVNPLPRTSPSLFQSGVITHPSLYLFDPGMSPDRACDLAGCTHGDSMVLTFNTSSANDFVAIQMVSKIGGGATSGFVLVKQSTTFDNDFTCAPVCRWGDYSGATPDPTKKGGATGEVWLTNQWTDGNAETWNWEATP